MQNSEGSGLTRPSQAVSSYINKEARLWPPTQSGSLAVSPAFQFREGSLPQPSRETLLLKHLEARVEDRCRTLPAPWTVSLHSSLRALALQLLEEKVSDTSEGAQGPDRTTSTPTPSATHLSNKGCCLVRESLQGASLHTADQGSIPGTIDGFPIPARSDP